MRFISNRSNLKKVGRNQDMVDSHPYNGPVPGLSAVSGGFVGRQREMGELTAALEDSMARRD